MLYMCHVHVIVYANKDDDDDYYYIFIVHNSRSIFLPYFIMVILF